MSLEEAARLNAKVLDLGDRTRWERAGSDQVFSRTWHKPTGTVLIARAVGSWWASEVFVNGSHVHRGEHDGREAAMQAAESAANVALHLRRFDAIVPAKVEPGPGFTGPSDLPRGFGC